jgi:hypothetical protein
MSDHSSKNVQRGSDRYFVGLVTSTSSSLSLPSSPNKKAKEDEEFQTKLTKANIAAEASLEKQRLVANQLAASIKAANFGSTGLDKSKNTPQQRGSDRTYVGRDLGSATSSAAIEAVPQSKSISQQATPPAKKYARQEEVEFEALRAKALIAAEISLDNERKAARDLAKSIKSKLPPSKAQLNWSPGRLVLDSPLVVNSQRDDALVTVPENRPSLVSVSEDSIVEKSGLNTGLLIAVPLLIGTLGFLFYPQIAVFLHQSTQ